MIRLKDLEDRLKVALSSGSPAGSEALHTLGTAFASAHGEMVLLLHWSSLNYAGLTKILKKHDKCTGERGRGGRALRGALLVAGTGEGLGAWCVFFGGFRTGRSPAGGAIILVRGSPRS